MKEIAIVDYIGNSDDSGNPVGHPVKVINDFSKIVTEQNKGLIIIPFNYKEHIKMTNNGEISILPFYKDVSKKSKILSIIKRLFNLIVVSYKTRKSDVIWFINVDKLIYIFLALPFISTKKRVFVTVYMDYFNSIAGFKNKIFNYLSKISLKKIENNIITNKKLHYEKSVYIPDFYINNKTNIIKEKEIDYLLLGVMNNSKDIEKVINIFKNSDKTLKIIGRFTDDLRFDTCSKMASSNISIENRYLSEDEYTKLLANSKYCILPYKEQFYKNRTSGVLLECVFYNTIPIAPKFLLDYNDIPGIEFNEDILNINQKKIQNISKQYIYIRKFYTKDNICKMITGLIES